MKKKKIATDIDLEIKRHIQALEKDIPKGIEDAFLEKIREPIPLKSELRDSFPAHRRWYYYGALATAATILLAILLFLYTLFNNRINTAKADEVRVQSAYIENQPADIYVVNPKESEIVIVWIEKMNNKKTDNKKEVSNEKNS